MEASQLQLALGVLAVASAADLVVLLVEADLEEASEEAIEAVEEVSDTKVEAVLAEEVGMVVAHLTVMVTAQLHPPMLRLVQVEEEALAVGMVVPLSMEV